MSKLDYNVNYEKNIDHSIKLGKKIRFEAIFDGATNRKNKNSVKLGSREN